MVVISRLVSTYLYQKDYSSKNSSAPTDPKELQKYIRQKVESGEIRRDRLPKGYTFPKEEDEVQQESMMGDDEDMLPPNLRDLNRKMGKKGKKGDRGKGKKGPKKQAAGKGKGSKGTKTAKGSTKATKKSKATKKPKKPISSGKP
ncbi:hypothetical protein HDE_11817 [Halotydeus destructor]|nr:hypothetical protein HDE_11817 [Halotydeus destructor]